MARTYGVTQISRFRHGLLLLRMVVFAWWKLNRLRKKSRFRKNGHGTGSIPK
jgi:hypothetical protein